MRTFGVSRSEPVVGSALVARLIVVEGLDGAGKRTLTDGIGATLHAMGVSVARLAFPRYGMDIHADLVSEALHGQHGDLADSVYGMAVLYALDRMAAREELLAALAAHDVVLLDRYIASNAAYGAARLRQGAEGTFASWVRELEVVRLQLPVPDRQLLLRVPVEVAAGRAADRERSAPGRDRDRYESDRDLQRRCAAVYDGLAAAGWLSPWTVLDGTESVDITRLAEQLNPRVATRSSGLRNDSA